VPLLIGITTIGFFIIQLAPGDYCTRLLMNPEINPETVEALKKQFGLDKPLIVQYLKWLSSAIRFDFGVSFVYHIPVSTLILQRLWNTLLLSATAMVLTWLIAVPIGIYCALNQYKLPDKIFSVIAFMGMSLPTFFIAFLCIFAAAKTGILPTGGVTDYQHASYSLMGKIWDYLKHLIIPVSVLVLCSIGSLIRLMRANMLDVFRSGYITTARAKGLSERIVIYKHALRNAINPMITIFGYQLSGLLSGAALTEIITRWPGLGRLMLDAYFQQDLFVVMASLMLGALLLIIGNLIADILLALTDPRIRYQ
jgi:peptide/nickel transport system permease protein